MPDRKQPLDVFRFVVFFVVMGCAIFVPAGTLRWPAGWMFLSVISAAVASVRFGIFRAAPDLVQERKTAAKRAKAWDRVLVPGMPGLPLAGVVLAGLGKRFSWMAPFPAWCTWLAFVLMALGAALTYWGMRCNRFFSSHVRIQTDRGHHVVRSGPYARTRHPGYAGALLVTLGTLVLLNSTPALVIALVTTVATVLRTVLEDRTLRRELPAHGASVTLEDFGGASSRFHFANTRGGSAQRLHSAPHPPPRLCMRRGPGQAWLACEKR